MATLRNRCWLAIVVVVMPLVAEAGENDGRYCWRPPSYDYRPATNQYVVVIPQSPHPPSGKPARPCNLPIERIGADPYPWGWFGARVAITPSRRGSYYGEYTDFRYSRSP